mgnify:CR=1 FL=1
MFGFLKRKRVDPQAALKAAIGDADLPSFPAVVLQVLSEIRDPDGTVARVGDLVAMDPGLSVRLLRVANSAGGGAGRRVSNVRHAVAMAGMAQTESLVLAVGVQSALPQPRQAGFDGDRYWRTAARRAAVARALSARLHPARAVESFTVALLQDMALPVLAARRGAAYGAVLEAWHGGEGSLDALEREEFGWDHGEVGTWMCARWDLPESLAEAIGSHHDRGEAAAPAVQLVGHLRETAADPGTDQLVADAEDRFGLPPDDALAAVNEGFEAGDALGKQFVG